MPSYFFDSNVIVKRYHRELGTDWVLAICNGQKRPIIYISEMAHIEVTAAIRRHSRLAQLHASYADAAVSAFNRHLILSKPGRAYRPYRIVSLDSAIVQSAAALCNQYWSVDPHPLRSLDALQIAAALASQILVQEQLVFVTADQRLTPLAQLTGFQVLNPEHV